MNRVALMVALAASVAAAQELVDIQPTGDAEARFLAVSGTGNATAWDTLRWTIRVVGLSGGLGGAAIAGTGDAQGKAVAISGLGDADSGPEGEAILAASGGGYADGYVGISLLGDSRGNVAVAPFGQAQSFLVGLDSDDLSKDAVQVLEDAEEGLVTVSVAGNASCSKPWCVAVSGLGSAGTCEEYPCAGTSAVSVLGPSARSGYVGVSPAGRAAGLVAAGGAGAEAPVVAVASLGPASSERIAFSATGDAHSGALAASLFGDATGPVAFGLVGKCNGRACFAVSPEDADGAWLGVSPGGDARGLVAGSAAGDATGGAAASVGGQATGLVAVAILGEAHAKWLCEPAPAVPSPVADLCPPGAAMSVFGDARGQLAIAPTGDATACSQGHVPCAAVAGRDATGFTAIGATGDADAWKLAASGTGNASCAYRDCAAVSLTGGSSGTFAVSGCRADGAFAVGLGVACLD